MTPAGDLGDVQGQRPHPVDVGDHLDGAHDRPKVAGDGCLQGEQDERALLGVGAQLRDLLVVGDDLLGQHQIGLQQRLGRVFHRGTGQPAHRAELLRELRELFVVSGAHVVKTTFSCSGRHEPA